MMRKRINSANLLQQKRSKLMSNAETLYDKPTDTNSALLYLSSLFPKEKLQNRLPIIIMKHQIYAFVSNRTEVDKYINEMNKNNKIRLFKLGNEEETALVYMDDYKNHVACCSQNNQTVANFMTSVVSTCPDISYSKEMLIQKFSLNEENISELIQHGILTTRDVGWYWLSIPKVGEFVKALLYGRRLLIQYLKRTKYKEMLQSELEQRKLPKKAILEAPYSIYDLIGNDSVIRVNVSTGTILRLDPELA